MRLMLSLLLVPSGSPSSGSLVQFASEYKSWLLLLLNFSKRSLSSLNTPSTVLSESVDLSSLTIDVRAVLISQTLGDVTGADPGAG